MNSLPEINNLVSRVESAKTKFEAAYARYHGQQTLINNLLETRQKMEQEAAGASDGWLKALIGATGLQTEETGKLTLMAGMAKENLARITPAIDEAREELLTLCYEAAKAGTEYRTLYDSLCTMVIKPTCIRLLEDIRPVLEILSGLIALSPVPEYEINNMLGDLLLDIKKQDNKPVAMECINQAMTDTNNSLYSWPGAFPSEVGYVLRRSPSPAQMALARNNPEKMKALVSGAENCKGFGG